LFCYGKNLNNLKFIWRNKKAYHEKLYELRNGAIIFKSHQAGYIRSKKKYRNCRGARNDVDGRNDIIPRKKRRDRLNLIQDPIKALVSLQTVFLNKPPSYSYNINNAPKPLTGRFRVGARNDVDGRNGVDEGLYVLTILDGYKKRI